MLDPIIGDTRTQPDLVVLFCSLFLKFVHLDPSFFNLRLKMELTIIVESETTSALMFRLLQLEQRFESYCTLHEEELAEIKDTLWQLREAILRLSRNLAEEPAEEGGVTPPHNDGSILRGDTASSFADDLSL